MANLITLTELKTQARLSGQVLIQSDSDLTDQITVCQNLLETRTGRRFDEQTITETLTYVNSELLQLRHFPVKSVTTLTVDDVVTTDYTINTTTGSIYLENWGYEMVEIEYVTAIPADQSTAKMVLADMTIHSLRQRTMKPDELKDAEARLDSRIQRLSRSVMVII